MPPCGSTPTSPTPEASATPCLTGNSSRTRRRAKSAGFLNYPAPCRVHSRQRWGITEPVDFEWLREDRPWHHDAISPSVFTVAGAFMDYRLSGSSSFEHTVRNIFKSGVVSRRPYGWRCPRRLPQAHSA